MASDLISRDALLDSLEEAYKELKKICDSLRYEDEKRICNAQLSTFAELTMRVRKAPTVDAEPVRHGEWKPYYEVAEVFTGESLNVVEREVQMGWECSVCGRYSPCDPAEMPYCHCGAKMDGATNGV